MPAPTSSSLKLSIILPPEKLNASGLEGHLHSHAHSSIYRQVIKRNLKERLLERRDEWKRTSEGSMG